MEDDGDDDDDDDDDDNDDDGDDDGDDDDGDDDNDDEHTLCEPAHMKCGSTCHKSHFIRKFTGKRPQTRS